MSRRSAFGVVALLCAIPIGITAYGLNALGHVHATCILCGKSQLPDPPDPRYYGTAKEIGTRGDTANPGAIYGTAFPHNTFTRERKLGGLPVRFTGFTTWADSATVVAASSITPGLRGVYVEVKVRIFNRDKLAQDAGAAQFAVWRKGTGFRHADAVVAPGRLVGHASVPSGKFANGTVYLYAGDGTGQLFVVYHPDEFANFASDATYMGIWQLP